jgi:hypothetical protein
MELLHAELRGEPAGKMEDSLKTRTFSKPSEGELDEVVADW